MGWCGCRLLRTFEARLILILIGRHIAELPVAGIALIIIVFPYPEPTLGVLTVYLLSALEVVHDTHLNIATSEGILVFLLVLVLRQQELCLHEMHNRFLPLLLGLIMLMSLRVRIHPWKQIKQQKGSTNNRNQADYCKSP